MKKKFYSVVLFALSIATFSCGDDDNGGGTAEVPVPKTATEATALANAVYGPLQTLSSSYSFLVESATETTISFEEKDETKDGPQVSVLETEKSNWYPIKVFNRLYTSIAAANVAIEKIGEVVVDGDKIKQEQKDLPIARAQFIRGYNYFQLVQLFGEVPLILSSKASDADKTTRRSIDDVYAQIVSDLTAAIAKLPVFDEIKSNPSQLAAKTILAKAYLTWGQKPLTQEQVAAIATAKADPAKPTVDNAQLQKAIDYANEVIGSGKYQLLPDYNQIWGKGNEDNLEVIYSISHNGDGIDAQGNHQTHCGFTWPKAERTDPHISYADISFEDAIPVGDARREYSYAKFVGYEDGNIDTLTWPLSIVRPGKWIHRTSDGLAKPVQPNDIDHIDFRLGEVYLIKAEAQWYAENGDKGLAAINALRSRAGVAALDAISEDAIQNEWSYELAFEQKHWLNLVRWRTYIQSIDKVKDYEYYKDNYSNQEKFNLLEKADPTRFAFYQRVNLHLHRKVDNVDGHFYRFPIPLSESYNDLGVTPQNPGY
ncbi:membrane protein [Bacteroidia bacterium]|nr:membrane protein [Bacteroidia bacterium]